MKSRISTILALPLFFAPPAFAEIHIGLLSDVNTASRIGSLITFVPMSLYVVAEADAPQSLDQLSFTLRAEATNLLDDVLVTAEEFDGVDLNPAAFAWDIQFDSCVAVVPGQRTVLVVIQLFRLRGLDAFEEQ
jgi:hypothetical protein